MLLMVPSACTWRRRIRRVRAPERPHELALDAGLDEGSIEVFEHLDEAIATAMENAL